MHIYICIYSNTYIYIYIYIFFFHKKGCSYVGYKWQHKQGKLPKDALSKHRGKPRQTNSFSNGHSFHNPCLQELIQTFHVFAKLEHRVIFSGLGKSACFHSQHHTCFRDSSLNSYLKIRLCRGCVFHGFLHNTTPVILPTVSLLFQNKTRFLYKLQLNNIQKHEFSIAKHFLESILYATEHVFDLRNKYFLYVCIRKLRGSQHCTFLPRGMYGSIVICLYLLTQVHNYT